MSEQQRAPGDLSACRVLVVDDSLPIRRVIGACLTMAGISQVDYAENGQEGLEKLDSFRPDLVILDVMMPVMDGFEMCRRLRTDPRYRRLPVLVQTALDSPNDRTEVFKVGATDVIAKPLHGPELIARVRVQLENRLLIENLEDYRSNMKAELDLASKMQAGLLPKDSVLDDIAGATGLRISAHFQPSAELGGDMWTVHKLGETRIGVSMIDFSGHGVTAALNTFRLHSLMHQTLPDDPRRPSDYLEMLNRQLVDLLPVHQFATMFYGIIDCQTGDMVYAAAGAPNPVFDDGSGGGLRELDASGLPLGITRLARYRDLTVSFPAGSRLMLYSDALIETEDYQGNPIDTVALLQLVQESCDAAAGASPVSELIDRFRVNRPTPTDDLTVVWIAAGERG